MENTSDSRTVLIVGGTPAGLQAAIDLADTGIFVYLIDRAPFIGGRYKGDIPPNHRHDRLLTIVKHPRITLWPNCSLIEAKPMGDSLRATLLQHPRYVDLTRCTNCGDCVAACPVEVPETGYRAIHCTDDEQPACAAIEKTDRPPCSRGCPAGIHVQGFIALTRRKRYQEALDLIKEAMPFPGICGRVCTHPCEAECRRREVDEPVAIRPLKRFLADTLPGNGSRPGNTARRRTVVSPPSPDVRVAVIGAGPAGLTAAYQLARRGYGVTVFEKLPVTGGMMAVGIPAYRLPRDVLEKEIRDIEKLGVSIRTGVTFGRDVSIDSLQRKGYRAIFIAMGLHGVRALGIAGEELTGVIPGIDLLRNVALNKPIPLGEKVIVVGGGNVAVDCAQTCLRMGADTVTILYRRTLMEMPAWQSEIEEAGKIGIRFRFLAAPVRIVGEDGRVAAVVAMEMTLKDPDASGRRRPVPVPGSEFIIQADTVIPAVGQSPETDVLGRVGLVTDRRGLLKVDVDTLAASRLGVFAGGDAVTGARTVVEAIAAGNRASRRIHEYLSSLEPADSDVLGNGVLWPAAVESKEIDENSSNEPVRPLSEVERLPRPRVSMAMLPVEQRRESFVEIEQGFTESDALTESERCLSCGPCSECMACVHVCQPGAIRHEEAPKQVQLEIGSIICADEPGTLKTLPQQGMERVVRTAPNDPVSGSAAAARASMVLPVYQHAHPEGRSPGNMKVQRQIGVFICECGTAIKENLDIQTLKRQAAALPDVRHVQVLPFSCTPEAVGSVAAGVAAHDLTRVILAACSCCALDQVCHSCTYQRIRCKQHLGFFQTGNGDGRASGNPFLNTPRGLPASALEFVNIRESCAWTHLNQSDEATRKAFDLLASTVAKIRFSSLPAEGNRMPRQSVLIAGRGKAGRFLGEHLQSRSVEVHRLASPPDTIRRTGGCYLTTSGNRSWGTEAVVLAPADSVETSGLLAAFGATAYQPRALMARGGLTTHRPGVFICDPGIEVRTIGLAAAARVSAWLARHAPVDTALTARVDCRRCRACGTCMEICEFGAPEIQGTFPKRAALIDARICKGCGTCASHCPSGAITAGTAGDEQLSAMVTAVLSRDGRSRDDR